jgi:UDP-N-acetylmuramyl pentapeptide phosphotransferase/UDP-N-acetylglucosamine-1-phosphate transferase
MLPKIRTIAKVRNLNSLPNERTSHENPIPNIGGVAFFVCLILSFYFISYFDKENIVHAFLPGLTILFIIGLKDDLVLVSSSTKLIAQLVAGIFLVFNPPFQITDLNGFLFINKIHFFASTFFTIVLIVAVINAFNLIDGIDGLAGFITIIVFVSFSVISFIIKDYAIFYISLTILGAILAFLRFNFSLRYKIFMGDTGSMIIGFMIAIIIVRFLSHDNKTLQLLSFDLSNLMYLFFAILFIPAIDTIRVFTIRILNGKNPFEADRNHIHHIVMDKFNLSHLNTSLIIGIVNVLVISVYVPFIHFFNLWICLGLTVFLTLTVFVVMGLLKNSMKKNIHQNEN